MPVFEVGNELKQMRDWRALMIWQLDDDLTRRPVAAVNAPAQWKDDPRALAILMSRAYAMQGVLLHMLAELEGDDDGARWADEIRMIRDELSHGGWREPKGQVQNGTDPATGLDSGNGSESGEGNATADVLLREGRSAE